MSSYPQPPREPNPPVKTVNKKTEYHRFEVRYHSDSIIVTADMVGLEIELDRVYEDEDIVLVKNETIPNPNYEKELELYNKRYAKYLEELKQYNTDLTQWVKEANQRLMDEMSKKDQKI